MKTITGKILICVILVFFAVAPMRQSSAQFTCENPGGGGGDPTPTPTPECYYQYWEFHDTQCAEHLCCEDVYLVEEYYCYNQLISTNYTWLSQQCWEY
jgi:hypothetical protein